MGRKNVVGRSFHRLEVDSDQAGHEPLVLAAGDRIGDAGDQRRRRMQRSRPRLWLGQVEPGDLPLEELDSVSSFEGGE